ncbi:structural maintenance of chromosomes protein 6 [Trichonephila inaurata madagascariensis]|uniref:Structural maintenance of chromosomes protein 6 n=1 Tax=Trichonephila inaurata madagascariensis TaxID=2747483 RepID=A0A8X7CRB3_9ARAC|nr:structural maintenance of chromosomes protein 6 [Trichonephila inaurata madagascariensis]
MKRPAKKETLDTAKKRKKFDLSRSEGKLGLIESVSVQNFMCHDNLSLSLGPHMNFIIGQNGSGKSAILTAIILALGGKASTTDRYSNVKGFVKKGKNKGKVEVVLRNTGILAYKPEEYGEKIIIVREFNREGTSSYKIKSESGTICSVHKKELENIVEAMDIPVDNPLCILTQANSKKFLISKEARPERLFEFFYKGTGLEALELKYKSMVNTKEEAEAELEKKKSSIPELKAELKKWKKLLDSSERISDYKKELMWATVIEMKKIFQKEEEDYQKLVQEINDREDSLEKCKIRFDEKCSELEEFVTEKRYLERSITDYRKTLSSLRNQFQDFASTLREKEGIKHRLESDVKQLLEEKIGLEKCIEEQQEKKLSTIEEERRRCELTIQDLRNKNLEMQNNINSLKDLRNKKLYENTNIEKKMDELKAEIVNHNSKYRKYNENLKSAENALQNKVNAFGEHTVKVLQEIENKRNAFIKLPVGPIGMHLEVKQPKYTLAIEFAIGNNLLNSFCVDNYQDSMILRDILRKFYRIPPSIVVSPFEDGRFDVKGNAAISTFPTVLEMLTIKNDIVANCLIDQAQIEKKLLVEDVSASIKLMNDPPKNCISAYLLNLDQICFHPSRFYSFGKSYPRSKLNSTRPEDITNLKKDCENEILEVRKKETCMRVFENCLKAIPGEISNLDNQIVKKTTEVSKNKNIIKDLLCREISKDMNCLQEDLLKKVYDYNRKQAELQKCILEVNEYKEKRDKLSKEIDLQMTSLQNSTNKFKELCEKENTLNKDKETLKLGKEKFQQELKLLENKSEVFKKNIEQSKEKIRIAHSNAEKSGECIDSGRSVEEIKLLIKETERVIETQSKCDREGLSRRYVEKLENINRAEQELKKIERYLMRIDGMIKLRRSKFNLIKRQTETTIDMAFIAICSGNGYKGRLEINSTKRTLALIVDPRSGDSGRKNQSSLSGGERSFVMIAFLLALWQRTKIPFRILDEYDVFMDSNNRQLSVDLLKKKSEEMVETQFVYLSPLDLPRIQESDFIQIIRLAAPKRKNEDND